MSDTTSETSTYHVSDLMTPTVISVQPETHVGEIARLMATHHISGLPVVDARNQVLGVVTEQDMILRNTHFKLPNFIFVFDVMIPLETKKHYRERLKHVLGITAREIMSEPAITISPDASIEELADLMVERRMNPVPVVKDGQLVGIISRSDLIRMMAEDIESGESA